MVIRGQIKWFEVYKKLGETPACFVCIPHFDLWPRSPAPFYFLYFSKVPTFSLGLPYDLNSKVHYSGCCIHKPYCHHGKLQLSGLDVLLSKIHQNLSSDVILFRTIADKLTCSGRAGSNNLVEILPIHTPFTNHSLHSQRLHSQDRLDSTDMASLIAHLTRLIAAVDRLLNKSFLVEYSSGYQASK